MELIEIAIPGRTTFMQIGNACPTGHSSYIWVWFPAGILHSERRYSGMSELRPVFAKSATETIRLAEGEPDLVKDVSRFCPFSQKMCGPIRCYGYLVACGAAN